MPIRIREIHVRANVCEEPRQPKEETTPTSTASNQQLIAICVEQVMRLLKNRDER